jgi:hypothetical protein
LRGREVQVVKTQTSRLAFSIHKSPCREAIGFEHTHVGHHELIALVPV